MAIISRGRIFRNGSRFKKRPFVSAAAVSGLVALLIALNAWVRAGRITWLENYSCECLSLSEWGFGHQYIPPEINPAAWPVGKIARCGNAFESFDRWRLGVIKVERCNR
jgi:hypothetical protein